MQKEMDTNAKVPPVQPVTDPTPPQTKSQATSQPNTLSVPAYIAEPTDYRLVIDKDPISGTFVYRTVDRATGETVTQFPSEQLMKMRDSGDYKAGDVFSGTA